MNFMGGRQGFYEEDQFVSGNKAKYSSSSSPSSSPSQHKGGMPPPNYHQSGWLDTKFEDSTLRCYNGSGGGGDGGDRQLDLMMDSSTGNNTGGASEDADGASVSAAVVVVEREHMFDKVVTPSDVGKLNRLVIPKQHAERYFPLDSSTNEKGLLLNFEDRNGKPWRFRYSYWNSSQSYVMTKGWSRFVKEKKLDAGDIVSFQRGVGELGKDRLFIDWRRRPDAPELNPSLPPSLSFPHHFSFHRSIHPWNPLYLQPNTAISPPPPLYHSQLMQQNTPQSQSQSHPNSYSPYGYNSSHNGSVIYFRSGIPQPVGMMQMQRGVGGGVGGGGGGGGGGVEPVVFDSVPVVQGKAAAKRLRLFGVNMECPITESDECDILSSTTVPHNSSTMAPHLSSSSIPYLQLRPYNGTPLQTLPSPDLFNKGKSSMSLDLDI